MVLTSPKFWGNPASPLGCLLEPLSWLYRGGAALHQKFAHPYRASVPVISIGNLVTGGAGKTPLTLALARTLQAMGHTPHILSRGYRGSLRGPVLVDPAAHSFCQVGDEPLLLASVAPTWVAKKRQTAATPAIEAGADVLLLDDGHQNYSLEKDCQLVVVDAGQGFGNGRVFPAGPLRQSLSQGLKTTTAIIFVGEPSEGLPPPLREVSCPILRATLTPVAPRPEAVVAFAGIGHPEKFHQTLRAAGYDVKDFCPFPDHYPYKEADFQTLERKAQAFHATLITTEKDFFRLPVVNRSNVLTLPIRLTCHPPHALEGLVDRLLKLFP